MAESRSGQGAGMTDGYEGEGFAALSGLHRVEEAGGRGLASRTGTPYPMHGHADRRPAQHRQVQRRGAMAHPAAVFAGTDVQPQVQATFNAPVVAVSLQERQRRQRPGRTRGQEVFGVDLAGRAFVAVNAAGQPGGLFDEGKARRLGRGVKGDQTAGFRTAAVAFAGLDDRRQVPRGKRRATGSGGVVARYRPRLFDCLWR